MAKARTHQRNTGPMRISPRCGARTRGGSPCQSPSVRGKNRCRMHGGAKGSGAPKGNQNALKHGRFTKTALAEQRALANYIRETRALLVQLKS